MRIRKTPSGATLLPRKGSITASRVGARVDKRTGRPPEILPDQVWNPGVAPVATLRRKAEENFEIHTMTRETLTQNALEDDTSGILVETLLEEPMGPSA